MNRIRELYNNCFGALLLGKQDLIKKDCSIINYCKLIEHDVQQESEYISCVKPISFSRLMLWEFMYLLTFFNVDYKTLAAYALW